MKMSKKSLENLHKKVMDHWYTNLMIAYAGELSIDDVGSPSCDYCKRFGYYVKDTCACCPVCLRTGRTGCNNTPWEDVVFNLPYYYVKNNKRSVKTIIEEIEFLESLREDEV